MDVFEVFFKRANLGQDRRISGSKAVAFFHDQICPNTSWLREVMVVEIEQRYFRPAEVDCLKGDSTKARKVLGWKPKVGFKDLVKMMVDMDLEVAKREKVLVDVGYIDAQQQL